MDERREHHTPEQRDKDIRPKEPSRHGEPRRLQEARSDVQFAVRTESSKCESFLTPPVMGTQFETQTMLLRQLPPSRIWILIPQ